MIPGRFNEVLSCLDCVRLGLFIADVVASDLDDSGLDANAGNLHEVADLIALACHCPSQVCGGWLGAEPSGAGWRGSNLCASIMQP